jgi:hypothetical protein
MKRGYALMLLAVSALSGCSATTSFTSAQGGSSVQVKESTGTAIPRSESFGNTTFGNYEFKVESPGYEPLYGVLPLDLNEGYVALDILFFCPALFFNIREVFPEYEFDLEQKVIRYRKDQDDPWIEYRPTAAESARARKLFGPPDGN